MAIAYCDKWLSTGALFIKNQLSNVAYFQCSTSILYFKAQALMCKIKLFTVKSEEESENLCEELDETIYTFVSYYNYSGYIYRKRMKPLMEMLVADYRYLSEEEYEFDDWFAECFGALDTLKKKRGKENQITYGDALVHVAQSIIDMQVEDSRLKALTNAILTEALGIFNKYESDNHNKIVKITSLLMASEVGKEDTAIIDSFSEAAEKTIDTLNINKASGGISKQRNLEQVLYTKNYLSAIKKFQTNLIEEAKLDAKSAIEHGHKLLNLSQEKFGIGVETQQVLQGMTYMSMLLYQYEKESSTVISIIELWEKFLTDVQNKNRENRNAYFANMTEDELSANITEKDIMAHLVSGVYNYDPIEASLALSSQINIGGCYILLGDIQEGLNCKKEVEKILEFNDDLFDDITVALITYPLYFNLYLYYYQHNYEEAEQYNQTCIKLRNILQDSEYSKQLLIYDQILEAVNKQTN